MHNQSLCSTTTANGGRGRTPRPPYCYGAVLTSQPWGYGVGRRDLGLLPHIGGEWGVSASPAPLPPRGRAGGGGGGNIGTESQGKVWIRRTEPNYRAAAPGCGAGGRRDGRRGRRHRAVLSESSSSSAGPFSCTLCAASSGSRRSAASRPPMWMDGSSKCSRPAAGTDSGVRGCGAPRGDACHRVP